MTARSSKSSADRQLDKLLGALPMSEQHRAFVEAYRHGPVIDEHNAEEARSLALELSYLSLGLFPGDEVKGKLVLDMLRSARLPWGNAFHETVLHRLADDPAAAVRHIEERDASLADANSRNALNARPTRQDWWSKNVEDCLDGHVEASADEVIEYLLETGNVFWLESKLHTRDGSADPIDREQVRAKLRAAKKRIFSGS